MRQRMCDSITAKVTPGLRADLMKTAERTERTLSELLRDYVHEGLCRDDAMCKAGTEV